MIAETPLKNPTTYARASVGRRVAAIANATVKITRGKSAPSFAAVKGLAGIRVPTHCQNPAGIGVATIGVDSATRPAADPVATSRNVRKVGVTKATRAAPAVSSARNTATARAPILPTSRASERDAILVMSSAMTSGTTSALIALTQSDPTGPIASAHCGAAAPAARPTANANKIVVAGDVCHQCRVRIGGSAGVVEGDDTG